MPKLATRQFVVGSFTLPALISLAVLVARPQDGSQVQKKEQVRRQNSDGRPSGLPILPPKKGDTHAEFRRKWGYDDVRKLPKADLWYVTDPDLQGDEILPLSSSALGARAGRQQGMQKEAVGIRKLPDGSNKMSGSPIPVGGPETKDDPSYIEATAATGGLEWSQSVYEARIGTPVDAQAAIDVWTPEPIQLSLVVHGHAASAKSGGDAAVTMSAGAETSVRPSSGGWVRVKLPVNVAALAKWTTEPKDSFTVGISWRTFSGKVVAVKFDNFDLILAAQCGPIQRAEEASQRQKWNGQIGDARKLGAQVAAELGRKIPGMGQDVIAREEAAYNRGGLPDVSHVVSKSCCYDPQAQLDGNGNVIGPPAEDGDQLEGATLNYVENEVPVTDEFSGMDTRTGDWLGQLPCSPSIGNYLPPSVQGLEQTTLNGSLGSIPGIADFAGLLSDAQNDPVTSDPTDYPDADTHDIAPTPNWLNGVQGTPWTPPAGTKMAFGGRDIVYVHGLKLQHIYDGLIMNRPFADVKWHDVPGGGSGAIYNANPAFFPSTSNLTNGLTGLYFGHASQAHYFGDLAFRNWFGDNTISRASMAAARGSGFQSALASIPALQGEPQFPVDGHVGQFLFANGYQNRFMVASFSCTDRLDGAVRSVLSQVGMAMANGVGVYNPTVSGGLHPFFPGQPSSPENNFSKNFGASGLVFITQSTGALVVDVAMTRAKNRPLWNVQYIPNFTRAHISAQGADGGSAVATAATAMKGLRTNHNGFSSLAKMFFGGFDEFAPTQARSWMIDNLTQPNRDQICHDLPGTIIQDLRPQIVYSRYRNEINSTPVQSLMMNGGHASSKLVTKFIHPGFDDNTVTNSSTVAGRAHYTFWPFGALAPDPALNFDLGLFGPGNGTNQPIINPSITFGGFSIALTLGGTYAGQPLRAAGYWVDQRIDSRVPLPNLGTLNPAFLHQFQAVSPSPFQTPDGMVLVSAPLFGTPWDPYWRAMNHYGFLNVAGDHFKPTHDQGLGTDVLPAGAFAGEIQSDIHYPEYVRTSDGNPIEASREESKAVNSTIPYLPSTPPGLSASSQLQAQFPWAVGKPLIKDADFPQNWLTRGAYIELRVRRKGKSRIIFRKWLFQRHYLLLNGWQDKMQFDYVYGTKYGSGSLGGVLH